MARSHDDFVDIVKIKNPSVEIVGTYTKAQDRIAVRCKECGYEWTPRAYSLIQGRSCRYCSAKRGAKNNNGKTGLKTQQQFLSEMSNAHPTIKIVGEYINGHTDIQCTCTICGHSWKAKPYSLLQGHGCPRCAKSGTSFMEQFILVAFQRILGQNAVLSRDKSLIGMELDIVVPSHNFALEPGNWYFHKRNLKRDERKREKCHNVGIRLITIYDQCPLNTEAPFDTDCFLFNIDLNSGNHTELKELTTHLLNLLGVDCHFSDNEWIEIEREAAEQSRAQKHDDFVEKAKLIRPDVEIIGHFTNVNTRLTVRCRNCGNEWNTIPAQLLSGYGCRKCGTEKAHVKFRKTQNEFVNELSLKNPNIEVIGNYNGRHRKISVKCTRCGNIWDATAGSLLQGRGCPECAKERRKKSK